MLLILSEMDLTHLQCIEEPHNDVLPIIIVVVILIAHLLLLLCYAVTRAKNRFTIHELRFVDQVVKLKCFTQRGWFCS